MSGIGGTSGDTYLRASLREGVHIVNERITKIDFVVGSTWLWFLMFGVEQLGSK